MEVELRISGTMENLFRYEGEGEAFKRPSALAKALESLGRGENFQNITPSGADLPKPSS